MQWVELLGICLRHVPACAAVPLHHTSPLTQPFRCAQLFCTSNSRTARSRQGHGTRTTARAVPGAPRCESVVVCSCADRTLIPRLKIVLFLVLHAQPPAVATMQLCSTPRFRLSLTAARASSFRTCLLTLFCSSKRFLLASVPRDHRGAGGQVAIVLHAGRLHSGGAGQLPAPNRGFVRQHLPHQQQPEQAVSIVGSLASSAEHVASVTE